MVPGVAPVWAKFISSFTQVTAHKDLSIDHQQISNLSQQQLIDFWNLTPYTMISDLKKTLEGLEFKTRHLG